MSSFQPALLRLGLRLATGRATGDRFRPVVVAGSGVMASAVLLHTSAAANASAALNALPVLMIDGMSTLRWMVVLGVALPVLGLVATAARLSAVTRDRRLARLQVLGLTPRETRTVATVETAALLGAGEAVGVALYLATRALAAVTWHTAAEFPIPAYRAGTLGALTSGLGPLAVAVAMSSVLVPTGSAAAWRHTRSGLAPRWAWRAAVLLSGVTLLAVVVVHARDGSATRLDGTLFALGAVMTVTGVLVVAPMATALAGKLLLLVAAGPTVRIAARRMQQQPASSTRVAAAMIVALFVLGLLEPLTAGFSSDPVTGADRVAATTGPQLLTVGLTSLADLPTAQRILSAQGVTRVEVATQLTEAGCASSDTCLTAFVGTCWTLTADLQAPSCSEQPAWLNDRVESTGSVDLVSPDNPSATPFRVSSPAHLVEVRPSPTSLEHGVDSLFVPADDPQVQRWLRDQPVQLLVQGPGGLDVEGRLTAALRTELPTAYALTTRAFANYVTTRNIVTALDAVRSAVLTLGLLTFLIAGIDQVLGRRESMRSLVLLGVPRSTLRRAQLYETLVPLLIAVPAASGLGQGTAASYLDIVGGPAQQWSDVVPVLAIGTAAILIASVTLLVLAVPKTDANNIRRP